MEDEQTEVIISRVTGLLFGTIKNPSRNTVERLQLDFGRNGKEKSN